MWFRYVFAPTPRCLEAWRYAANLQRNGLAISCIPKVAIPRTVASTVTLCLGVLPPRESIGYPKPNAIPPLGCPRKLVNGFFPHLHMGCIGAISQKPIYQAFTKFLGHPFALGNKGLLSWWKKKRRKFGEWRVTNHRFPWIGEGAWVVTKDRT